MQQRRQTIAQILFVLAALGFAVSMELITVHVAANTDASTDSFCNINAAVSCDIVARSTYSVLLGLPVAVWGTFWYSFSLMLLCWASLIRPTRHWLSATLVIATTFSEVFSLTLAAISLFWIKSLCIMCAASWVINIAMNALSIASFKCSGEKLLPAFLSDLKCIVRQRRTTSLLALATCATLALLWLNYPRYWSF